MTDKRWVTEFKVLDAVTRRDGALTTRKKMAIEAGDPRLVEA